MTYQELLPSPDETAHFTPDWRMSQTALQALAELLLKKRPRTILETGPGLSSLVIFRYQQFMMDEVEYTIVDEEGPWHEQFLGAADHYLSSNPLVHLVTTPLGPDGYYNVQKLPTYPARYDLILLDGPGESSARGSVAVTTMLSEHVSSHTCLLVDDTHRQAERELVQWLRQLHTKRYNVEYDVHEVSDELYPRITTILCPPLV